MKKFAWIILLSVFAAFSGLASAEELPDPAALTVEEQVLLNTKDVKVTLHSLEYEARSGPTLHVTAENRREEEIILTLAETSVNGLMLPMSFIVKLAPGEKREEAIIVYSDILWNLQILYPKAFVLRFDVQGESGYSYLSDRIAISTSLTQDYTQALDESGQVVLEAEGLRVLVKYMDVEGGPLGPRLHFLVQNNREHNITVQALDMTIDGERFSPTFSSRVSPGMASYDVMHFNAEELAALGIAFSDQSRINCKLQVFSAEDESFSLLSEPITFLLEDQT